MAENDPDQTHSEQRVWEDGWEGHERLQRERQSRLTLEQKLKWLEEADDLARHLASQSPPRLQPPEGGQR